MKYAPSIRGMVIGTALWCTLVSAGCGFGLDSARTRINDKGEEVAENFKIPKPDKGTFVGPPAPDDMNLSAKSFSDGKASAKADFNKTVSWATGIALWIFIPLAIIVALASFVVPWIPTKAAIYCAVSACAVVGIRYALLVFGTIAVDWAVYISAASAVVVGLVVGLPMVIAWMKRNTWKRGVSIAESHPEGATALLASVDPKIDKVRKSVEQWLIDLKGNAEPAATEARMNLVKLNILPPGDK